MKKRETGRCLIAEQGKLKTDLILTAKMVTEHGGKELLK